MSPELKRALVRISPFLVLSLLAHLGVGVGTHEAFERLEAALSARRASERAVEPARAPDELAWLTIPETPPTPEASAEEEASPEEERLEEPPAGRPPTPRVRRPRRRRTSPPPPEPVAEPEPELAPEPEPEPEVAAPALEPPPPPPEIDNRQAVTQRSQDPSVAEPEDARFIADENNRVEEETVATIRSLTQDAPEIAAGAPLEASAAEMEGNADESEAAETEFEEGADERAATPEEAASELRGEAGRAEVAAGPHEAPQEEAGEGGDEGEGQALAASERPVARGRRGDAIPSAETHEAISDGLGTIYVPRASAAGEGGGGGEEAAADRRGRRGRAGTPNLRVTWNQYAEVMGEENLEADRNEAIAQRRSRSRGGSHQERWERFQAAIENYVPSVRPGNQTALNTAASPFASYLAEIHRRLHAPFRRFRDNLPSYGDNPFSDESLHTKLEIILNRDGSIHLVGVAQSSGFLPFDFGAFNAVQRGAPYPEAPASIVSADGRVYLHWTFFRNQRACGTFNAEPYILGPDGAPRAPRGLEEAPATPAGDPGMPPTNLPPDGALGFLGEPSERRPS